VIRDIMDYLAAAEALDGYRAACKKNAMNWEARDGQGYEMDTISDTATKFLQMAAGSIPLLVGSKIVILNSEADNGFPHTRPPNLICIPASLCKESEATRQFRITLAHEAIHVHQRKRSDLWFRFVAREGWSWIPSETIPSELHKRVRINPDTIDSPFWAWDTYLVPLPLFRPYRTATLSNAVIEWYDIRSGSLTQKFPPSFLAKYGAEIQQPEHPYEIYAEKFSEDGVASVEELEGRMRN
jgi:hypothetical protein